MAKIDGIAQMIAIMTVKEMSYLVVDLFDDLVSPAFVLILVTLRFLPALFAVIRLLHKKGSCPSPTSYNLFP